MVRRTFDVQNETAWPQAYAWFCTLGAKMRSYFKALLVTP